jgi:hypothetical protein
MVQEFIIKWANMEAIFFFVLMLIAWVVWLVNKLQEVSLDAKIGQAYKDQNWTEWNQLIEVKKEHEKKKRDAERVGQANQTYIDGIAALDAAKDGFFYQEGYQAVRNADLAMSWNDDRSEDDDFQYDDDWHAYEPPDEGEGADHWGPV